jgi:DNA-binding transcriptional regulator YiaG
VETKPFYMTPVRASALEKYDNGFTPPTSDEVREVKRLSGKTGKQIADMLGVDGRTVRKWVGGEREMPYAAWRLLVFSVGLISSNDII